MDSIARKLGNYFTSGGERTAKVRRNVALMLLYKGGGILIGLLMVPLTINYVDSENYGIWITLSSMVAWMNFFDIGLNNGLRNKLAEALASNNLVLGKKYVSTTYALLFLIFIPLMIVLLAVVPLADWSSILHLKASYNSSLIVALCILSAYFCLNTIFSTINVVMMSYQQPAEASLRQLVQQAASLVIIWVLTVSTEGSLTKLCIALCAVPLLIIIGFNLTLFNGKYSPVAPSYKAIDFHLAPKLMKMSIMFFIIQIAAVVQWQMANFLIIRHFGAVSVTEYNIAYKYLGILSMVWMIFIAPLWSASTDAMARGDYKWIGNTIRKFLRLFALFALTGVLMVIVSPWIYSIWIGGKVYVPTILSAAMLVYNLALMFANLFVYILNGCGILKVQMYACIVSPFVYLGIFYFSESILCSGIYSVIIASVVANFNGLLLAPLQCRKLLKKENAHSVKE